MTAWTAAAIGMSIFCNLASSVLKRSAPFGTGTSYGQQFDPTLGGLVGTDGGTDR